MAPRRKEIPFEDVKGLKTLLKDGFTQEQIAEYYHVSRRTVKRRIDELHKQEGDNITKNIHN